MTIREQWEQYKDLQKQVRNILMPHLCKDDYSDAKYIQKLCPELNEQKMKIYYKICKQMRGSVYKLKKDLYLVHNRDTNTLEQQLSYQRQRYLDRADT